MHHPQTQDLHKHEAVLEIDLWSGRMPPPGALQKVLGDYLGSREIRILRTSHKKPFLEHHPVHFNMSHAAGLVAIALSPVFEVGIDIEPLRRIPGRDLTLEGAFSEEEQDSIAGAKDTSGDRMILEGWVRKEACLKALGTGLLQSPRSVQAGFRGEQHVHLNGRDLMVAGFHAPSGYVGAVARLQPKP